MAEAGSRHECAFCIGHFIKPKILPCFHTFCEPCLDHYIRTVAVLNKFDCPICRSSTTVPANGAAGFATNFYINTPSGSPCTKHRNKELEFYCNDCHCCVCANCAITDHRLHKVVDLSEIESSVRATLSATKTAMAEKMQDLKSHAELLKMESEGVSLSAKTVRQNIDKQVEKICAEVKKLGADGKKAVDKVEKTEVEKLKTRRNEIQVHVDQLQLKIDDSAAALSSTSAKSVIDIAPEMEEANLAAGRITTVMPDVKHPCIDPNTFLIDKLPLKKQLGQLRSACGSTFHHTFNLKDILKDDINYFSKDGCIHGLPWRIFVKQNKAESRMGIFTCMKQEGDKKVKSCDAEIKLKLLHQRDNQLSIEYTGLKFTFIPGQDGYGWIKFIDYKTLEDPANGFLDSQNKFTVIATVKIVRVEKR